MSAQTRLSAKTTPLHEHQRLAARILDSAPEPIIAVDATHRIIVFNRSAQQVFGYTPEEALGQPLDFLLPIGAVDVQLRLAAGLAVDRPLERRMGECDMVRGRRKNGELFPAGTAFSKLQDEDGPLFVVVVRDLTERRHEKRTWDAESWRQRLAAIVETTTDLVAITDIEGRLLYCNPAARRMLEIPKDEDMAGVTISDALPEWARAIVLGEAIPAAVRDGVWIGETALLGRNGREVPVSQVIMAHRGRDGRVEFLATVAREIGERQQLQAILHESEERFRNTLENAPIGMAVVGTDGRWLQVNRLLCELTGYTEQELLATTFRDITYPEDFEDDLAIFRRMLDGEMRTYHAEKRYRHRSGHEVWVLLSVSLVRDAAGQPLYFIAQAQDISDRKRTEAALVSSYNTMTHLTEVAKSIADGNVHLRAEEPREGVPADLARALNQMADGLRARIEERELSRRRILAAQEAVRQQVAEQLHGTVQSRMLVLWYRLKRCQELVTTNPAEAFRLVGEVRDELDRLREDEIRGLSHRLHPAIVKTGFALALQFLRDRFMGLVQVSLEIHPSLEELAKPRGALSEMTGLTAYRVVEEALSNAVRHGGATCATLKAWLDGGDTLVLVVRDNGNGFDPKTVPQNALGLKSLADYVEALGGFFRVDSAPGQGTCITAHIPVSRVQAGTVTDYG